MTTTPEMNASELIAFAKDQGLRIGAFFERKDGFWQCYVNRRDNDAHHGFGMGWTAEEALRDAIDDKPRFRSDDPRNAKTNFVEPKFPHMPARRRPKDIDDL